MLSLEFGSLEELSLEFQDMRTGKIIWTNKVSKVSPWKGLYRTLFTREKPTGSDRTGTAVRRKMKNEECSKLTR